MQPWGLPCALPHRVAQQVLPRPETHFSLPPKGSLLCNLMMHLVPGWQVVRKCFLCSHTWGVGEDGLNLLTCSESKKKKYISLEQRKWSSGPLYIHQDWIVTLDLFIRCPLSLSCCSSDPVTSTKSQSLPPQRKLLVTSVK